MSRLLLAAVGVALLAAPAVAQEQPVADAVPGTRVIVLAAPGLRWEHVEPLRTPTLSGLVDEAATGVLSVKAQPAVTCPADGWLTLAAGARADAGACAVADVADRDAVAERNIQGREAADVDALVTALREQGSCMTARGAGAELTGADAARQCPVLLVEAPAVRSPDDAVVVDELVAQVQAARSEGSTLLVVGLSALERDDEPTLQLALAHGAGIEPGALRSASTRRAPYVQLVDVAPTVLDLLGIEPPEAMTGQPWQSVGEPPTVDELGDLELRAAEARRAWVPFFVVLVAALLAGAAVAARRRSARLAEVVGLGGVSAVTASYLAGLVPWWRAPTPGVVLVIGVLAVGVAAGRTLTRLPGTVRPAGAATGALALVLALDLLAGGALQMDAPAGYSALVAGRFAGVGNVAFGVFAAAVLLALAAATHRAAPRRAAAVVAVGGAVAVVLDGAPPFGSDVGGVLALVPALVLLGLLRSGRRVRLATLAGAALAGAVVVTAFAVADWRRDPADRTHLGRFVEQVRDGTAGTVLRRKADAVVDLLLANAVTVLLPLVVAGAVWLVARPPAPLRRAFDAVPAWRHGLLALGLVSAIGFAVNDSGLAVPALALLVAVPATVAVVGRVSARRGTDTSAGG